MRFKRIYVEITNECNLSCSFCPTSSRKTEYMDQELFVRILKQLQGLSRYIYLHVKGEPLLHPRLIEYIRLCHEYGFRVNLTTNGTLIKEVQKGLLETPGLRQISFSLQSFEDNKFSDKPSEALKDYLTHITEFAVLAVQKKIFVELRLWNLDEGSRKRKNNTIQTDLIQNEPNQTEVVGIKNSAVLALLQSGFSLEHPIDEAVMKEKGFKLKEYVYLSQSYEFEWPSMKAPLYGDKGTCYGLRQQLAILVDGTVVPCCLDQEGDINLGNIKVTEMNTIITSRRVETIVKGFENMKINEALCMHCGYRKRFDTKEKC